MNKKFLQQDAIIFPIVLIGTLMVISAGMFLFNRQVITETTGRRQLAEQVVRYSGDVNQHAFQAFDKNTRGFALTKTENFLNHIANDMGGAKIAFNQLDTLLRLQQQNIPHLKPTLDSLLYHVGFVKENTDIYHAFGLGMMEMVKKDSMAAFRTALAEDRGAAAWNVWFHFNMRVSNFEGRIIQDAQHTYDTAVSRNAWLQVLLVILGLPTLVWIVRKIKFEEKARRKLLADLQQSNREHLFNIGGEAENDTIQDSIDNLKKASVFIKKITDGDLDLQWDGLNDENRELNQNTLVGELLKMQHQMKTVKQEDQRRKWASEGLNFLGEMLRKETDLGDLANRMLAELIKYVGANQGVVFILNDADPTHPHLELKATYAYNRKKFMQKTIAPGEGLAGQAWQEADTVYLREIPQDYVRITSGLGDAQPNNLLIVPLKHDGNVQGVLELASFRIFQPHEIAFIEKIAENTAVTFAAAKITERTNALLQETQQMTEQMRAQEEEMRQSMEELMATQEEVMRKENEYLQQIRQLETENEVLKAQSARVNR